MPERKFEYTIAAVSTTLLSVITMTCAANTISSYIWYDSITADVETLKCSVSDTNAYIRTLEQKITKLEDDISKCTFAEEVVYTGVVYIDETESDIYEPNPYWWKERLPENGNIDTNRYDCEPDIFGKNSQQKKLQQACSIDPYTGIKVYSKDGESYYCAAMASAYGVEVGEAWRVTLECGSVFNVILSDFQQPITDPDPNYFGEIYLRDAHGNIIDLLRNYDGEPVCHVLEFVVDLASLHPKALKAGNAAAISDIFGGLYGNGGNIVEMKYLGKVWEP